MIAYLHGNLIHKSPMSVIIDVNGVGYLAYIPLSTYYGLPDIGVVVALKIHTHVREDEIRLFGFATAEEKTVFEKLIGISNVGPKTALAIVSGLSVKDFVTAVATGDIARLSSIPGVGRKTAERLVLEMKDKLKDLGVTETYLPTSAEGGGVMDDALSALLNLGYKKPQAELALKNAFANAQGKKDLEYLIRECLKIL